MRTSIRRVLDEERTGFELGPQSWHLWIDWMDKAPYCLRTCYPSNQSIDVLQSQLESSSPRLEHGQLGVFPPKTSLLQKIKLALP